VANRSLNLILVLFAGLLATGSALARRAQHFDVLIRGGEIVDGSGAARYRADLGIQGENIAAIGDLPDATGDRVVDARGRIVTPGFIDMHAHVVDGELGEAGLLSADLKRRAAQNYVAQGVTTVVTNPDGAQSMPLAQLAARLRKVGTGVNVVMMNGHSGLRAIAMHGDIGRAANAAEIRSMQAMLRRDLAARRSFGMSLGLEYDEARHASREELIALGKVLGEFGAVFIPHLRSQGVAPMWYRPSESKGVKPPTLDDSIDETLHVAAVTGATVVFTHMKAWGPGYRGEAQRIIARLQAARDQGQRVYMDVYPYDSSGSDGAFVALPPWALDTSIGGLSAERRADLDADVRAQIALKGGAENIRVLDFPKPQYIGKSYAQLMQERGLDETGLAIALKQDGFPEVPGGARMRSFSMAPEDIERFFALDWCAVSTDGWIVLPEEASGALKYANTNRRVFGSFPRRIAHYVLERNTDTLEHAVRSMSGLPAGILKIDDRGRLAVGTKADVVVMNLGSLRDNTTYLEPSVYPDGVDHVLINGRFAVADGQRTLALAGKVLSTARVKE
jgi:N-acyl-D-amino-acid deacylase